MKCAGCGKEVVLSGKVGRESLCPHCGAYLHTCLNCRFYAPGRHNDCIEPQAEPVTDKRGANFCDYFVPGGKTAAGARYDEDKRKTARDRFEKLFGG